MGLEDLTTLDAAYPKGDIEPVSVLDNYQRETRAKLKAWAAKEHDLVTGHHAISTVPANPAPGRMYYDKITGELRYYMNGPPGYNAWRSVIQPPFNYIFNPEFKMMTGNVSPSFPCGWWWSAGAGQTITQDSVNTNPGKNSILLATPANAGGAYNTLNQAMSTSNPRFLPIDYWRGRTVSFGCYIASGLIDKARVQLNDGIQYVNGPQSQAVGAGVWDWCVTTMTVGAGATDITATLICDPSATAYNTRFSEPTLVEGAWCARPVPQGHPQRSHVLTFGTANAVPDAMPGINYYGPMGRSTNAFLVSVIIPYRYCVRNLAVYTTAAPGAGQSYQCQVVYNSVTGSNIVCTISDFARTGSDDVHPFQGDANSTISLAVTGSGAAAATALAAHLYIDELPW